MEKMCSTETFLERAKLRHKDRYDYSKVEYVHSRQPVIIGCAIHGDFLQTPTNHLNCNGCPKCAREVTNEMYLQKVHAVHGDKYDYSKVVYTRSCKPITIICSIHGEFEQTAAGHLSSQGCPHCEKRRAIIAKWPTKRWTFYVFKLTGPLSTIYKIGGVSLGLKQALSIIPKAYTVEILHTTLDLSTAELWDIKYVLKRKFSQYKVSPSIDFSGSITDCFSHFDLSVLLPESDIFNGTSVHKQ